MFKPELKVEFSNKYLGDGITAITAPMREQIYLIEGKEKVMVIDNGMGIGSLKEHLSKLTNKPIIMVDTHGHPDHAGGNIEFDKCYLNFNDLDVYRKMVTKEYRVDDIRKIFGEAGKLFIDNTLGYSENIVNVNDGDEFDLGDRIIKVYLVPGHTPGSIVLLDVNSKTLFVGDALTIKDTWVYLDYSTTLKEYYDALLRLKSLNLDVRRVLCGHIPNEYDYSLLDKKIRCVEKALIHHELGERVETFAGVGYRLEEDETSIIYNPERIK